MYDTFTGNDTGVQYAQPKKLPYEKEKVPSQMQFNKEPNNSARDQYEAEQSTVNVSGRAVHEISPMQAAQSFWRWFTRQSTATNIDAEMTAFMRGEGIYQGEIGDYDKVKKIYIEKYRSMV